MKTTPTKKAEEVLSQYEVEKRFLFVPDKEEVTSDSLEVMDVRDLSRT